MASRVRNVQGLNSFIQMQLEQAGPIGAIRGAPATTGSDPTGKGDTEAADSPPALPAKGGAADLVLPAGPLHLLEVGEVGALPGQIDEVGEDHPSEADVEERVRRARVDVLLDVAVDGLIGALLDVVPGQARLQVSRHLADLHAPDLVVQGTQRHG